MKKALLYVTVAVFAASFGSALSVPPAFAQSGKDKAALAECKNLADPKAKDECVKKAAAKEKAEKAAKTEKAAKAKAEKVKTEKAKK